MANMTGLDTSSINSLFGDYLQDPRLAVEQKRAYEVAQLDPMQQLSYQARSNAPAAGRQLAGLFGVQDPVMKEQSIARQVRQEMQSLGLQPNQQEYWDKTVQRLGELGASRAQAEASSIGLKLKEQLANIGQKTGENINTLIASGKFTPESLGVYAKTRNPKDLEYIDKGLSGANLEKVASAEKANDSLRLGNADIDGFLTDLKENKVVYGPVSNIIAKGSAAFGSPTDNALKQQEIESFITGSINDVLNSAKGVQAKDDALRAERQIKGYLAMNSNEGVRKALERLKKVKEDTIKSNETYINVLTKGKGTGTTTTTKTSPSGQYADDYAKYKQKYGNQALPYEAYVRKRNGQ